ncbi:efflux RND transporter periplasmic adaptor subunit [Chitinophaga sp. CCNWLW40]|uniref:efflux RND transporter periplasmic adaptor subunit n=2 Tax=Chitinophaga TaxID=79328 RepID=UPI0030105CFC
MKMTHQIIKPFNAVKFRALTGIIALGLLASCGSGGQQSGAWQQGVPEVAFIQTSATDATVEKKYPGLIEGSVNVDIKAQVSGYLEAIYVKEGDFVNKGQSLFRIKGDVFNEQVNSSQAALKSALAAQANASLEIEKLKPLVAGKVVSEMQLKTAQSAYDAATAQVAQAAATLGSSRINAAFAIIKAPVSGYIGRIPNRTGNLVTPADAVPLTSLSEIDQVFVYFSMSEAEYLSYVKEQQTAARNTVELIMADGSVYNHKGTLETASGNIDRSTGSISLKAVFPNPDKLLRSGGSARIVVNKTLSAVLKVPMASVKDIQDKFFVFVLADSNKVTMQPIEISGRVGENYLVRNGIRPGSRIAVNNIETLGDGMPVVPKIVAPAVAKQTSAHSSQN